MELGQGWNQSETVLRQLIHLDWIYGAGPVGSPIDLAPLFSGLTSENVETVLADLRSFDADSLIDLVESYDPAEADCVLTAAGAEFVEQVRQRRGDLASRRKAARDAVLRWLYDRHVQGTTAPQWTDFWSTPEYSLYYAQQFGSTEVDQATIWLRDRGYVKGTAAWGGVIPRPMITADGEDLIESGRSLTSQSTGQPADPPSRLYINTTGSGNIIQVGSPAATANIATTISHDDRQQTLQLAQTIEAAQASLPPEAATEVERLRAAVEESQADPGALRRALQSAKTTLATGAGDIVGKVILGGFGGLLARYGIGI